MKDDHRSYIHNFYSWEKKAWKKFRLVRDSNPWPLRYRCSALPIKVASITAMTILHLIRHSAVHIYDFHIFKTSLKKHSCTLLVVLIVNNYCTRLSKISWFVCGKQINYLPQPSASANNWSARHWQLDHRVCFIDEYPWEAKRSAILTQERSQEGEKHGFLYACAEYYLQPNTVGRHCAWADHYL